MQHIESMSSVRELSQWKGPRETLELLCGWDLSQVMAYLVKKLDYSSEHVEKMRVEYLRFMALTIAHRGVKIPIAKNVDDFWHTHIIHTKDYRAFSEKFFDGEYIDHQPTLEEGELAPYYLENTLVLYEAAFGPPTKGFWLTDSQVCLGPAGQCGSCD